jgi:Right handed beta helix region
MSRRFHSGAVAVLALALGIGLLELAEQPAALSPPGPTSLPTAVDSVEIADCDRFASPSGSDFGSGRGGFRHPYRSVPRLLRSLRGGQTGCLEPGVYRHGGVARMTRRGAVLRGIGPRSTQIRNPIWFMPSATGAQLLDVSLTSSNREYPEPLKVQADRVRIASNQITGSLNTICILIGSQRTTRGVIVEGNRISHCGRHGKLDHLIYVQNAVGTTIRWNLLTDNPGGWAVHLYPDADGTLVEHNIIDGNQGGVIFAGEEGDTSDRNVVRDNAITYSGPRWNIEGSWSGGPTGRGNLAYSNCLFSRTVGGPAGIGEASGFAAGDNLVLSESPYVDRGSGDYAFLPESPCRLLVGDVAQATIAGR